MSKVLQLAKRVLRVRPPSRSKENAPLIHLLHGPAHWRLGVSSGLLGIVAGAKEGAIASPVWKRPGIPLGPRGWIGQAWQGWSLAAAAGRLHSGGSPRRSRSSYHPGPL